MVRYKNRYVVVEINMPRKSTHAALILKPFSFYNAVIAKVQQMHGDYGAAAIKAGFTTKYCNEKTRIALIKVRHGPHRILASSLPFIDTVEGINVSLNTLYTGATMKHCFKFIQNYQKKRLYEMWSKLKTDKERKTYESALMDFNLADQNDIKMI